MHQLRVPSPPARRGVERDQRIAEQVLARTVTTEEIVRGRADGRNTRPRVSSTLIDDHVLTPVRRCQASGGHVSCPNSPGRRDRVEPPALLPVRTSKARMSPAGPRGVSSGTRPPTIHEVTPDRWRRRDRIRLAGSRIDAGPQVEHAGRPERGARPARFGIERDETAIHVPEKSSARNWHRVRPTPRRHDAARNTWPPRRPGGHSATPRGPYPHRSRSRCSTGW